MQEVVAALAIPMKSVDVARDARALDGQLKGIRCKPGGMRDKRRLEQARSLGDESDLLDTLLRSIMELEIATKRILNLVARVDVEFAAIFAAARDERHGVGRQP